MKSLFFFFTSIIGLSTLSFGAQTLQFNTSAGRATNFLDAASGQPTGLLWGIVVDTAGDGFDNTTPYSFFSTAVTSAQVLRVGDVPVITDDVFVPSANLSLDSSAFGVSGGPGTFGNIAVTYNNGIAAGQHFAFLWLNDGTAESGGIGGDKYGFFDVYSFNNLAVMPNDAGGSTNFGAIFSASEPIRNANVTFAGGVPEPSRLMLLGLGGLGLVFRRRRC